MPFSFTVAAVIPANARDIYDAWLDGIRHAQMTGSGTAKGSTEVGGEHEAWDGYITGRNLVLEPGKRIVQSWRTTQFTGIDADSQIEVTLVEAPGGTLVTLTHSNVPDGHTGYQGGWGDHYFEPMKAYFAAQIKAPAKAKPVAKTKPKAKAKPKAKPKPKPKQKKAASKAKSKPAKSKKAAKKPARKAAKKPARKAAKKPARKAARKRR